MQFCLKNLISLKVVGNEKGANVHNMSLTAAIDVLFFVNFAVIFDFMYFRFCPSKAKSIGTVEEGNFELEG